MTCANCGNDELTQDSDVLDTWFSSALWPFSTLGWPAETAELKKFYPTSVLVTGFDILFFWVARMMMMGLHFMGKQPFDDVYVHALVRDAQGQKMSKSKGNVIDPLVMMDVYGTDALRFTLAALGVQGRDVKLSEERIEGYKHFVNKLWNASRLVMMNLDECPETEKIPQRPSSLVHRWMLSRLQRVTAEVDDALEHYYFNQYANSIYHFLWHEYCDWYLEMIKQDYYGSDPEARSLARAVAVHVLGQILILLHPVMPFVTEEIWQKLPGTSGDLAKTPFPVVHEDRIDPDAEAEMDLIMGVVNGIRNIRGEMNVPPATRVETVCVCATAGERDLLRRHGEVICDLARLSNLKAGLYGEVSKPRLAANVLFKDIEVYVVLKDILDFGNESSRLRKEIAKLEKELTNTQKKLANEDFLQRAPGGCH